MKLSFIVQSGSISDYGKNLKFVFSVTKIKLKIYKEQGCARFNLMQKIIIEYRKIALI